MITPNLQKMIGEALKAHDEVRLSTLRLLSSAFNYERIEKQHELTDEEEIVVIRKQAKQRKDSIEAYTKANRPDMAKKEEEELKILQEVLPPEMDEEELNQLISDSINQLGAKTMADMGKVIGMVKSKAPSAEGGRVAQIVRQKLESSS